MREKTPDTPINNKTIYENGEIKVTHEFLQIGNERCQISDIYKAIHFFRRDWRGVLGFSVAAFVIGNIVISFESIEAFLIGFLFMAVCIFIVWISFKGRHSLIIIHQTDNNMKMCKVPNVRRDPDVIDNTIAAIESAKNVELVKSAMVKAGIDVDKLDKEA